jgi:hypothetical protein
MSLRPLAASRTGRFAVLLTAVLSGWCPTTRAHAADEFHKLARRLLARPTIQVEPGFTARVLVPPGQLYDPLWMLPRRGAVWLNDDGGEEGDRGSRLLAVDSRGRIVPLADLGTLLPVVGFDIAPDGFGAYAGQIFTLAQARVGSEGTMANHVIQRVEPERGYAASVFCTLPSKGGVNQGVSGYGSEARFGPPHTPFQWEIVRGDRIERHRV